MGCEGIIRDPVTGVPAKVNPDGALPVATGENPVQTMPVPWSATSQHGNTVTDTAAHVFVSATPGRVYIRFMNTGSQPVYLFPGAAATTSDMKLLPNQTIEVQSGFAGDWYAITASGQTTTVAVWEFTVS